MNLKFGRNNFSHPNPEIDLYILLFIPDLEEFLLVKGFLYPTCEKT